MSAAELSRELGGTHANASHHRQLLAGRRPTSRAAASSESPPPAGSPFRAIPAVKDLPPTVRTRVRFKGEDVLDLTDLVTQLEALGETDQKPVNELDEGLDKPAIDLVGDDQIPPSAATAELVCDVEALAASLSAAPAPNQRPAVDAFEPGHARAHGLTSTALLRPLRRPGSRHRPCHNR